MLLHAYLCASFTLRAYHIHMHTLKLMMHGVMEKISRTNAIQYTHAFLSVLITRASVKVQYSSFYIYGLHYIEFICINSHIAIMQD